MVYLTKSKIMWTATYFKKLILQGMFNYQLLGPFYTLSADIKIQKFAKWIM